MSDIIHYVLWYRKKWNVYTMISQVDLELDVFISSIKKQQHVSSKPELAFFLHLALLFLALYDQLVFFLTICLV